MMQGTNRSPQRRLPRSFYRLLAGQTVSLVGSQVTLLALPLSAIELLHASPFEIGVLLACGRAPYLLLGLLAGVLVDRFSHRMLSMTANMAKALTLGTVPLAASMFGQVGMPHLYSVAIMAGTATVILDVAFLACVPTVVRLPQLVQAQSRLELGQSAALVLGLPLAGWLIATFTAPIAILTDAVSFQLATALLLYVAMAPATGDHEDRRAGGIVGRVLSQAAEGARFVLRTSQQRAVTLATSTFIFCYSAYSSIFLLYLTQGLDLTAAGTGAVTGIAVAGGVVDALLARPAGRALGLGGALVAALLTSAIGAALTPLFQVSGWLALVVVGLSQFLLWTGQQVYNVHQEPIRYALAPPELHGRVNASIRIVVWGLAPLGAQPGGACGSWLGSRTTLLLSGAMIASATAWIVASPLWAVRTAQLAEAQTYPTSEPLVRSVQEGAEPLPRTAQGNARADTFERAGNTHRTDCNRSLSPAPNVSTLCRQGAPYHEVR